MSSRLVFVVTVDDNKQFEIRPDTRRITRQCGVHWNETYQVGGFVSEVKCGPEFPSLSMFGQIFIHSDKDMVICDAFDANKWRTDRRRAWGIVSTMPNFGMVIINHNVVQMCAPHCAPLPKIEINRLYCLMFRHDEEPRLIDTEGMAPSDFHALVEEAGARVATER